MSLPDLSPFWLSLKVAGGALVLVIPIGTMLSWWLSHHRAFRGRILIEILVAMPLVLPPTAVGFYLLLGLGRGTSFGRWLNDWVGVQLLFTWQGASVAAAVMSLPLFVRTAEAAFSSIDRDMLEMARTLGGSDRDMLGKVILPLAYRGFLAAAALAFARALGEFGATMMVAGAIPGETQTLPIALYQASEAGRESDALAYTLLLTALTVVFVSAVGLYLSRIAAARSE